MNDKIRNIEACIFDAYGTLFDVTAAAAHCKDELGEKWEPLAEIWSCLLYTSPSPRDGLLSRMPSSA